MTGRNKETTKPRPIKNKRVHRFAANQPANALIANRRDPNTKHRKQLQRNQKVTIKESTLCQLHVLYRMF